MGARRGLRNFSVGVVAWGVAACSTVLGIDEDYRLGEGAGPALPPPGQCSEFAVLTCTYRDACCQTVYSGQWTESWKTSCVEALVKTCEAAADSVPDLRDYQPDMWLECKSALAVPETQCFASQQELFGAAITLSPCFKIITGTSPRGGPCKSTPDCAYVEAPGKALVCHDQTCVLRGAVAPGEPCVPGPGGCGPGLYCAVPPGENGGQCVAVLGAGAKCQADVECGLGSRCVTGACQLGLPTLAACAQGTECQSGICFKNVCAPLPAFTPSACQGMEPF